MDLTNKNMQILKIKKTNKETINKKVKKVE